MKSFIGCLIFFFSLTAHAEKFADWATYNPIDGFGTAETTNQSGSSFGYLCDLQDGTCTYYLIFSQSCAVGDHINLLISTRVGSGTTKAECMELGKGRILAIFEPEVIQLALETGGEVGFAIALDDGNFMSYRFSSQGAILAIKNLYMAVKNSPKKGQVPASDRTF